MLGNAFQRFPGQVQPVELGIMPFQRGDDPDRLRVVVKPAVRRHQRMQRILACVAKGRMPQIMRQRHRLGQLGVQVERRGHRAGHLRHLDRMGQPCDEVVLLRRDEHLGLVLQPPKRARMDDPVAVALKAGAKTAFLFRDQPSPAERGIRGIGRALRVLSLSPVVRTFYIAGCKT